MPTKETKINVNLSIEYKTCFLFKASEIYLQISSTRKNYLIQCGNNIDTDQRVRHPSLISTAPPVHWLSNMIYQLPLISTAVQHVDLINVSYLMACVLIRSS